MSCQTDLYAAKRTKRLGGHALLKTMTEIRLVRDSSHDAAERSAAVSVSLNSLKKLSKFKYLDFRILNQANFAGLGGWGFCLVHRKSVSFWGSKGI